MDAHKKSGHLVATLAVTLTASCSDNRLPPNPVPHADLRRPIPAWFDPNAAFNPEGGSTRVYIEGKIVFEVDKAIIKPQSEEVLQKLLKFLQERTDITRLRIEGHTDATASDEYNQELSAKRSLAVADWLVDRGIDHVRLVAVGFGEKKPIGPNDKREGRAENRRTEFHVMEVNGRPFGPSNVLDGGMVLSVLSAEERARLKAPPKVVFAEAPPFNPTGNEIKEFSPKPKQAQEPPKAPSTTDGGKGAPEGGKAPDGKAPAEGDKSGQPKPVTPAGK